MNSSGIRVPINNVILVGMRLLQHRQGVSRFEVTGLGAFLRFGFL